MDLDRELVELATRHADALDGLPWASERARWAELVFCVINSVAEDPASARAATEVLDGLGLLAAGTLARAAEPGHEGGVVLRYVLTRHGLSAGEADEVVTLLAQVAASLVERHDGRIQRFLRHHGHTILDDLLGMVPAAGARGAELRRGFTHWLQNAVELPLSVMDTAVREFLDERGATLAQLEDAADEVDFNLALVDDIIRADRERPAGGTGGTGGGTASGTGDE
jgi:hypothetical protein